MAKSRVDSMTVEDWFLELERGFEYRQLYGLEARWAELEALFYNVHPSSANVGPNLVMSVGDALLSALSIPNPVINIQPRNPEAVRKAPLLKRVDNTLYKDLSLQAEMEMFVLHAYLYGRGIFKLGYDSEYGYDPTLDILGDAQLGITMSRLNRKGDPIEFNRFTSGMPWAKAVLPHDIIVPWGTVEIENDARWVAHRVVRHVDEVKQDSKYSNTRKLQATMSMKDFVQSYTSVIKPYRMGKLHGASVGPVGGEVEFVELFEIHDRQTGKVKVIASGHDKFLRDDFDVLQLDGRLPFVSTCFIPNARTFWVTPDAAYIRHAQLELADIAIQASKQRRMSVLKLLYSDDAIDEAEMQKALSRDVGVGIKVNSGFDPRTAISTLQPSANQQLYQDEQYVRSNAREQVGFSRNQFGEFAGRRTSASEAQIVDRATAQRMSRREIKIKRVYEAMFEKLNNIIFHFWRAPQVIDVIGPQDEQMWVQFTGPQLKSQYDYEVTLSDEASEEAQRMQMLNLYMALREDPSVDQHALRQMLVDVFNDVRFSTLFPPGAENAGVQLRMSEMQGDQGGSGGAQQRPALAG